MEEEGEEKDIYVQQLREVFLSCDADHQGVLNRHQLKQLCIKLQVEEQADRLIGELLDYQADGRVEFETFKEGFVRVLSEMDGLDDDDDDDVSDNDDDDNNGDIEDTEDTADQRELIRRLQELTDINEESIEPRYTSGDKRYGRRSRPQSRCEDESPVSNREAKADHVTRRHSTSDESVSCSKDGRGRKISDSEPAPETFEAEGQLNQAMASMENALDPLSEEEHLREIWRELGVGTNGALTLHELAAVCQHIGMEEMNEEEMQHLFDKLDVDADGQVSFQEFLHGLFQHGGPTNPPTPVSRTLSTPRQKLKLSLSQEDRTHTPSYVSSEARLFSALDTEGSGFATPEAIIDAWENLGVPQAAEILEYLQFDLNTKISLGELTSAMQQELHSVEEDNAAFQAALVSCFMEIKYLRTVNEHVTAQRDKLQVDLAEASTRIANLVKEGDDRTTMMERIREKEMQDLEKRYQDQIKVLLSEAEEEREAVIQQSNKQRQKLEADINKLKEEEARLKDKLHETQQEVEKLEKETMEMTDNYSQLEEKSLRQLRELDVVASLQKKLEEMESNRELVQDEKQKFQAEKVHHLESENKDLKDRADELTMEVEDLKQQLSGTKRRGKSRRSSTDTSRPTKRSGSILSDYTKPTIFVRNSFTSDNSDELTDEDNIEDFSLSSSGRQRRLLPQVPSEIHQEISESQLEELQHKLEEERAKIVEMEETYKAEIAELEATYKAELNELRAGFDIERREIDQVYKLEITEIEEQHKKEKQEVLTMINNAKDVTNADSSFQSKLELEKQQWRLDMETEVQQKMEEMKRDILIRTESEKNHLLHQHEMEKKALQQSLDEEIESEVKKRLEAHEELLRQEIITMLKDDADELHEKLAEAEKKLESQKEELSQEYEKKVQNVREEMEREKQQIKEKHSHLLEQYENIMSQGEMGLEGQLKQDFDKLVEEKIAAIRQEDEKNRKEITRIEMESFTKQQEELLQQELEKERAKVEKEVEKTLQKHFESEEEKKDIKQSVEKEKARLRKELEQVEKLLQQDLEDHKVKAEEHRHERERQEMKILQLEKRLAELQETLEEERNHRSKELKDLRQSLLKKYRTEVLELEGRVEEETKKSETLKNELLQLEQTHETLKQTNDKDKLTEHIKAQVTEQIKSQVRKDIKEKVTDEIKEKLEEEYMGQLQKLKTVLSEEKQEIEAQVQLLQQELDDMNRASETDQKLHEKLLSNAKDTETKLKIQIEELNANLKQSRAIEARLNNQVEELKNNLEQEQLMNRKIKTEKEIMQKREEVLVSTTLGNNPDDRDRVIVEAIKGQTSLLENVTQDLKLHLNKAGNNNSKELLLEEKILLHKALDQLHHKMQDMVEQSQKAESYKAKLERWETERDMLRDQLHASEKRTAEANTALSLAQSQYIRELRNLQEQINNMVDIGRYNALHAQLTEAQSRIRDLEISLEERSKETTKLIVGAHDDNKQMLRQLEEEKDELRRKLSNSQQLLDETVLKLRQQFERMAKTDLLVKDLYIENAHLMESLYETEKMKKDAYSRMYKLEGKCKALEIIIKEVTVAALEVGL